MHAKDRFISPHFNMQVLADGVYAALHKPGGGAIANAGIVDLGDRALVFDTFISPLAAKELRLAAEILTGNPVACVINSHYHNDHIRGNQVFLEAEILATQGTLELLHTAGQEELEWDTRQAPLKLAEVSAQYQAAQDDGTRSGLKFRLDYLQVIIDSLPGLEIRYPDRTFTELLTLAGPKRRVEVISYGPGHTRSDAFLWLPEERIAFLSDLLFVGCHPYLPDGDPHAWMQALDKIKTLRPRILVPGHGPVGRMKDLNHMARYIIAVSELARGPASGDEINHTSLPYPFKDWEYQPFFPANLEFMRRGISGES